MTNEPQDGGAPSSRGSAHGDGPPPDEWSAAAAGGRRQRPNEPETHSAADPDGEQDPVDLPAVEMGYGSVPGTDDQPDDRTNGDPDDDGSSSDDEPLPLEEVVADRPIEAVAPLRGPLALAGTGVAGFLMGTADVVPGFSGGTVALVVGIYERLIANVRQGARALSLLVRGKPQDALRAVLVIEWPFVTILLAGILTAILTLAGPIERLSEEEPVLLKSVFFGLVLGAAVIASKELRTPNPWHVLIGVTVAFATFVGLGLTGGLFLEPSLLTFFIGGAIAVCAMILPGVSGSFLLVMLGLYTAVLGAVNDRNLLMLLVFTLGCVVGLAAFSTLLNWLLARFHDLVLAALIGLMVGSVRVLWPYPSDGGFENVELGAPEGTGSLLALALALTAFSLVWMLGLLASAVQRRRSARAARKAVVSDEIGTSMDEDDMLADPVDPHAGDDLR